MIETYVEQPAVNRVAVRLWVKSMIMDQDGDVPVRMTVNRDSLPGWLPVYSDGNGGWELRIPQ